MKYINFKNPLFRFFVFLSFFSIISTTDLLIATPDASERNQYVMNLLITLATSAAVYYMTRYGFGVVISNPINFFITALIVYLLMHPTNNLMYFVIAVAAIAVGKYLFKKNNVPVFNPAALALVLTYIVSMVVSIINPSAETLLVSWWGADMFQNMTNSIPVLNILVPVFFLLGFVYYAHVFRKIPYVAAFFGTFIVCTLLYSLMKIPVDRAFALLSVMLFNSTAFCALVMIPEPKTSPNFVNQQIPVGIFAGVTVFIFNTFLGSWPIDAMVTSILVANLATFGIKSYKQPFRVVPTSNPQQ